MTPTPTMGLCIRSKTFMLPGIFSRANEGPTPMSLRRPPKRPARGPIGAISSPPSLVSASWGSATICGVPSFPPSSPISDSTTLRAASCLPPPALGPWRGTVLSASRASHQHFAEHPVGVVLGAVGLFGTTLATDLPGLLVAAFVFGIACGGLALSQNLMVEESRPVHRRQWLSGLHSVYGLASWSPPWWSMHWRMPGRIGG